MTRLTVACCATLFDDGNALAMCLGQSSADAQTFTNTGWQDAQGNLYAAASFMIESMTQDPQQALERPEWDVEPFVVNMAGASRAQAALVIWDREGEIPQATPRQITVVGGMEGSEAMAAMGLHPSFDNPDDME